jgi:hypothetical protein
MESPAIAGINVDGKPTMFTATRRKKSSVSPKSYCTISEVDHQQVRLPFTDEMAFENWTSLTME